MARPHGELVYCPECGKEVHPASAPCQNCLIIRAAKWRKDYEEVMGYCNVEIDEQITCFSCTAVAECKYAWDLYNSFGDCIADK